MAGSSLDNWESCENDPQEALGCVCCWPPPHLVIWTLCEFHFVPGSPDSQSSLFPRESLTVTQLTTGTPCVCLSISLTWNFWQRPESP